MVGAALFTDAERAHRVDLALRPPSLWVRVFSPAHLSMVRAVGASAAGVSKKLRPRPLRLRGPRLTIASSVRPARLSWQQFEKRRLLSASALPAPSEPASAMNLCRCQTTWVSQSSPPPATRARTALAAETPRPPAGPPALLTLRKRAQAPTRPKARDPPGNWLFLLVMNQRPAAMSAPF